MSAVELKSVADINWRNVQAIAYDYVQVALDPALLAVVEDGRQRFLRAIEAGQPCYGVTTGLGKFVERTVGDPEDRAFVNNVLLARAAAQGPPLPRAVSRSMFVLKLTNFLSGRDGVRPALCEYLIARLNDGFTPWIPSLGHGMGADATANSHAFQTLIGEGFVWAPDAVARERAGDVLKRNGIAPYAPDRKEALALINGIAAAPAYALDAHRTLSDVLSTANVVAASSLVAAALPLDSIDPAVAGVTAADGIKETLASLQRILANQNYTPHKLQAPVSFRVVPQVHGALVDALQATRSRIEECFANFSDNPMLAEDQRGDERFLSIGAFHNQHLVNQVEQLALALAHVAALSERRLHRLLDAGVTGLNPQLAGRPGLDAGLVTTQKAALDLIARVQVLAQPVSLHTGESSGGQEDYMSMAIPAIHRLYEMAALTKQVLAYEFLAVLTALDQRAIDQDSTVGRLHACGRQCVPETVRDRAPGPDAEALLALFASEEWRALRNPSP